MQNNMVIKVKYFSGNNIDCDYYIIAEKEEIALSENDLVYKIGNTVEKISMINSIGFTGNYDYVLVEENKVTKERKHIFCNKDEIEKM